MLGAQRRKLAVIARDASKRALDPFDARRQSFIRHRRVE